MERDVRATRRELAGYDSAISAATDEKTRAALQQEFDRASVKLKKQEGKLKDWIKEKELTPDPSRVQVNGFGRSVSQKAVWANKRELTAQKERDTIKAIKSAGIKGEIHLVPKSIDASTLTIDSGHIKERGHNISEDEAKRFIKEAKFSSAVWKGKYERYFSADGAAYVDTETNTIRTAFGKDEYDDVTIAALEEYDKWMNQ